MGNLTQGEYVTHGWRIYTNDSSLHRQGYFHKLPTANSKNGRQYPKRKALKEEEEEEKITQKVLERGNI